MQGLQMRLTQDPMYILPMAYIIRQVHLNQQLIFPMEILQLIHQRVHHSIHIIISMLIHSLDFLIKNIHFCRHHCPATIITRQQQHHRTIRSFFLSFYSFACVALSFFVCLFLSISFSDSFFLVFLSTFSF